MAKKTKRRSTHKTQTAKKTTVPTSENLFDDLTSERFKIDPKEVSDILQKEIRIDRVLKEKIEACIKEKCGRELTIFEHTSYIAPKGSAQEITFANQLFALLARCYDYANAVYKYLTFFETEVRPIIEQDPNVFDSKDDAKNECISRLKALIPNLPSISVLDQQFLEKFLTEAEFRRGAKEIINYSEIKTKKDNGKFKIGCRSDALGSCVLANVDIPNASSDCMSIIANGLVQEQCLYNDLRLAIFEKKKKKEIIRKTNKVDFFRQVLKITISKDKNLSNLSWKESTQGQITYIKNQKLRAGRFAGNPPKPERPDDWDQSIQWDYNGKTFYANNEITPEEIKSIFPEYNNAYKEYYYLEDDPLHNEFVMYEYIQLKSATGHTLQQIFFGAPGTGKSHKINHCLFKEENVGLKELDNPVFRTTFHPDYDYAQFVGSYKPTVESNPDEKTATAARTKPKQPNIISYSFVPQVFAKAYAAAWKSYLNGNKEDVFLVIEEINRGNCAQIFGDIFQLLDRVDDGEDKGFSQYSIDADSDFAKWLEKDSDLKEKSVWPKYEKMAGKDKLRLPPNLNILATTNTSDQSLFPMDSAFKRRFDWEYVPISFVDDNKKEKECAKYEIEILDADNNPVKRKDGTPYLWKHFVDKINDEIQAIEHSEDKKLGEFFVKPDKENNIISYKLFLGKVMFYLWNDICKDEHEAESFFFIGKDNDKKYFTFQDLYGDNKTLLKEFMDKLLDKPSGKQ